MTESKRIYVDNAATSWPKPPEVLEAMVHFYQQVGSSAGRGNGRQAIAATEIVESTRSSLARFINAKENQIQFAANGTSALNQAIFGLLQPGDHVITTQAEHNSVLRPLRHLDDKNVISVDVISVDECGRCSVDDVAAAITNDTRLIVSTHASNVTGALQPVKEIGQLANDRDLVFLLDAAQTVGHFPIDIEEIGCHLVAAPGHKGLLGPLGTGFLFVDDAIAEELIPLVFGGTGTESESDRQPKVVPGRFESGNLNTAAIAGLGAGIKYLESAQGIKAVKESGQLVRQLGEGIRQIEGINVFGPAEDADRVGLFSFTVDGTDSRDVAAILESTYSIETRAGFHCAPLIHATLCTGNSGGTVRLSLGVFNTPEEVTIILDAIKEIAAANIF